MKAPPSLWLYCRYMWYIVTGGGKNARLHWFIWLFGRFQFVRCVLVLYSSIVPCMCISLDTYWYFAMQWNCIESCMLLHTCIASNGFASYGPLLTMQDFVKIHYQRLIRKQQLVGVPDQDCKACVPQCWWSHCHEHRVTIVSVPHLAVISLFRLSGLHDLFTTGSKHLA